MQKKLTITVDERVYDGLHSVTCRLARQARQAHLRPQERQALVRPAVSRIPLEELTARMADRP